MKFIESIKYLCVPVLAMLALHACSPDETDAELGPVPSEEDVTFTFSPDTENPNIVNFSNTSTGFIAVWDFGNGTSARGNEVQAKYPVKGDYTVTLRIIAKGGTASSTQVVNIAETNPLMLDIPEYNFLTGGPDALDGKTWVIDKETPGHMGIGPADQMTPDWWSAPAGDKEGKGIYDDEFTFKLAGFSYEYETNGDIYVNEGFGGNFPGAVKEANGNDFIAPYDPPAGLTWSLNETEPGKWVLTINGSHMGYFAGANTYEILSISEDEMHVRYIQGNAPGNAWYHKLIRKGYTRPVEAPEYKIEDMNDDFDGNSTVVFHDDGGGELTEGYDNPAPVGINTSSKVARYVKADGAGAAFANVQIRHDYKMDLRDRHVFRLKVFVPSYNDYTTEAAESWQSYKTLQKQVSVKLQNRELGGNAWTTQTEIIQPVAATDEWVELTFDFSGAADREDYDQIVIQIGGEAIHTGGIFFLDDFELLPL